MNLIKVWIDWKCESLPPYVVHQNNLVFFLKGKLTPCRRTNREKLLDFTSISASFLLVVTIQLSEGPHFHIINLKILMFSMLLLSWLVHATHPVIYYFFDFNMYQKQVWTLFHQLICSRTPTYCILYLSSIPSPSLTV